jgi:hypothetical protein
MTSNWGAATVYSAYDQKAAKQVTGDYWAFAQAGVSPPPLTYHRSIEYLDTNIAAAKNFYGTNSSYRVSWLLYGWPGMPSYKFGIDSDELMAKATKTFYSKLRVTDFNALVTLAELPKTLELVATSAVRLASAMKSIKRFDGKGLAKALQLTKRGRTRANKAIRRNKDRYMAPRNRNFKDYASNTWLEVTYGWKPLLYDVEDGLAAFTALLEANDADFHIRARRNFQDSVDNWGTGNATVKHKATAQITGEFQVIDPQLRNFSGIGLTSLSSVVWELIPYSFVVDWFVPIGSYFEAMSAMEGVKFLSGSQTSQEYHQYKGLLPAGSKNYRTKLELLEPMHYNAEYYRMQRKVLTQVPPASTILKSKNVMDAASLSHTVSAIALMNNAFRLR